MIHYDSQVRNCVGQEYVGLHEIHVRHNRDHFYL